MGKPSRNRELQDLQNKWYRKLKKEGFKDIEDHDSQYEALIRWDSHYFQRRYDPQSFDLKKEYYDMASRFLEAYPFPCSKEKRIWELHSQGFSCRFIARSFKGKNFMGEKDTINKIIVQLIKTMKNYLSFASHDDETDAIPGFGDHSRI